MRRPLTRHLSEGGGSGAAANNGRQRQRSSAKEGGDERGGGYTWTCRDYSHHLSFGDLLKAPALSPAECRGRATISPESRSVAIYRSCRTANTVIFALHNEGDHLCGERREGWMRERERERGHPHSRAYLRRVGLAAGRSSIDRRRERR